MKKCTNSRKLIVLLMVMTLLFPASAFAASSQVDVYPDGVWEHFYYGDEGITSVEGSEEGVLEVQETLDDLPIHLLNAQVAVKAALETWNENTNWGAVGGNLDAIRNSALNAANAASMAHGTRSRWISPPQIELGGVNIFDGPFFNGILELSFVEPPGRRHYAYVRVMFVDDRRIEWNSTYWENRNKFPADGIARSDMERNMYELVHGFGTSRAWGAPNIRRVADYIEAEFLEMGFPQEQVEIIRVDRRNRGQNPDGSNLPALAIPWIGELNFNVPGETNPVFKVYSHYGNIHYAGLTLPGNDVVVGPEDWPFEAITGVTLVDIGTFPILSIPEGTTGDVIVAVRFVEANLNLTTQLAPALEALMVANPEVNIQGAVVARTGRIAWQRGVPGITGGPTSPFPVIMSSCMNLTKLIDRGEDLASFGLVRRTHNYGVVATIPADVEPGEDPDMIIVVSAHMDSQGLNSPGASDNASGTVVAMDLARYFSEQLNEYGVIPGNRIEIHLAPVGAHEGGGGVISIEIANRIVERGLGGIAINMNMDMVMSPSARADGILMDTVSMDTWMPPAPAGQPALPAGDAGLRFNLPAYLVMGSITGVAGEERDPVLADGIVNARIFRFAGSEHQRFNESPRFIEAASMIIVEDTTGTNDIGTFYHNAMDNMIYEYCYTRLRMSRDLYLRGISRAMEQEMTKWGQFTVIGNDLILENASQLFQTFDRVAGELVVEDTIIPFEINYPDTSFTAAANAHQALFVETTLEETPGVTVRHVMASGYGVADHRNTQRLNNHQHLRRFSTGLAVDLNLLEEVCLYALKMAILYMVENFDDTYNWHAGTVAARQPTATGVIWDAIHGEGVTNDRVGVTWIATPVREAANITAPGIFAGVVRLTYFRTGATIYVPVTFVAGAQTPWTAPPEVENRNQVPVVDGVLAPRSPLETNTVNLVDRFGQRLWGTPNEYHSARYVKQAFISAGLDPEDVEFLTFNRYELGTTAGQRAPGFAGRLAFTGDLPDIYGNALPNSPAFPTLANNPRIVDLGTFPNLVVPTGITGDVVVALRFDTVQLQVETQLAPALKALEEEYEINIQGVLLARGGDRAMWEGNIVLQGNLPGVLNVTNPGHEETPFFPMILLTNYHLEMALERGAKLNLIERYERTDIAAVHALLPASTDEPDMVIVLTAHLDGVTAAPSVSDNGASVAAMIEMARYFVNQDRGNIEIRFLANGGHEVGGMGGLPGGGIIPSLPVRWIIADLQDTGLDAVTINMDFNMIVSPGTDPQGNPLDALSVGVLNRPINVDRVDFNLSAHLLLDHLGSDPATLWAPGIVNARISNFSGADAEDFTDAGIDAASLAVRSDLTEGMPGGLGREIWYHTAFDNLQVNYCYTRLKMSANVMREAIRQSIDQETTRRGQFAINTAGYLVLVNAEQIFQTFDQVEGTFVFGTETLTFVFTEGNTSLALTQAQLGAEIRVVRDVVASGAGNPDHNPRRPARTPEWIAANSRFSTTMVAEMVELIPEPILGLDIFNNGPGGSPSRPNASFAASGTIRMWTQLDGVNTPVPFANLTVDARLPDGSCAIRFVTINRPWVDQTTVNFIDVTKNGPWPRIYLTATLGNQSVEVILVNSRFFTLDLFNNGCVELGATPSRPNPGLEAAGTIRIWTQLNRTNAPVPHSGLVVTARRTDESCAMEFVTINRPWVDQTTVNFIDVNKRGHWDRIYLTATVFGQSVEVVLVNRLYEPVVPIHFTFDIFNNGEGGSPSRPNPGIEALGVVRLWTQIDGRNIPVPYKDLTVTARLPNGECAMSFVRINRPWADQSTVNHIDVNKRGAWERIYLTATLPGATTAEVILVNRL